MTIPPAHRTGRLVRQQLDRLRDYTPIWELVVRSETYNRYRFDEYSHAVSWRDRASCSGATDDAVGAVLDRTDPMDRLSQEIRDGEHAARFEQITALWPFMLPHHPELLAAHSHSRLNRGLAMNRSGSEPLLAAFARSASRTGSGSAVPAPWYPA